MSLRSIADHLNLASSTRSKVTCLHPSEDILFASATTILETDSNVPIGWSLRRLLQRRGNVVITSSRIFVESGSFSPLTAFWLAAIGFGIHELSNGADLLHVILIIVGALFIFQRRPYSCNIRFRDIESARPGSVHGIAMYCDIVSINFDTSTIQLVPAQLIPATVREMLASLTNLQPRVGCACRD